MSTGKVKYLWCLFFLKLRVALISIIVLFRHLITVMVLKSSKCVETEISITNWFSCTNKLCMKVRMLKADEIYKLEIFF